MPMTRWRTLGRIVGRVLAVIVFLVVLGVLVAGSIELWLRTPWGRDFLESRLERVLSHEIRGLMRIGGIDRYSFGTAEAHDVEFLDPRGEPVIQIPRAELGIDLGSLFSRTVRLEGARARHAVITIAPGHGGKSTSIEETFASGRPKRGGGGGPRIDIDTGAIHVEESSLVIAMGHPRFHIENLEGFVRVSRTGDRHARVRLDRIDGAWALPGLRLLDEAHPFHGSGRIDGNKDPVVDLSVRACFPRGEVPARVRFGQSGFKFAYDADEARLVGLALRALDLIVGERVEAERSAVDVSHLKPCS
jgi:hypothetical protein